MKWKHSKFVFEFRKDLSTTQQALSPYNDSTKIMNHCFSLVWRSKRTRRLLAASHCPLGAYTLITVVIVTESSFSWCSGTLTSMTHPSILRTPSTLCPNPLLKPSERWSACVDHVSHHQHLPPPFKFPAETLMANNTPTR